MGRVRGVLVGRRWRCDVTGTDITHRQDPRPVVVGVGGSPDGHAALVQALVAAARRGAPVLVVSTYAPQSTWAGWPIGFPLDLVRDKLADRVRVLGQPSALRVAATRAAGSTNRMR